MPSNLLLTSTPRILVVDSDQSARAELAAALELGGFSVASLAPPDAALRQADDLDAVVLDVQAPEVGGIEVARSLRAVDPGLPVIAISANTSVEAQVAALDAGVDDYVVKPISRPLLLARLRALMRRARAAPPKLSGPLTYGDLELNVTEHRARRGPRHLELTRTEFALLELLLRHPEEVMSRGFIFGSVWGYDVRLSSNSLGVFVGMLRRKTEAGGASRMIHTVRGVGYVLRHDVPSVLRLL